MIILYNNEGQLGNRLIISAHAIVHAKVRQEFILDGNLLPYVKYFSPNKQAGKRIFFLRWNFMRRVFVKAWIRNSFLKKHCIQYVYADWGNTEIDSIKRSKKILYLHGVGFRNNQAIAQLKDQILEILRPKKEFENQANILYQNQRKGFDIIVGLHIRRGDYKQYEKGKYFYSISFYKALTEYLDKNVFKEKKIKILICSDESPKAIQSITDNIFISNQNEMIDLLLLSKCDYIIGPPSTFSLWASFIGNKPIYHLFEPKLHFTKGEFKIRAI